MTGMAEPHMPLLAEIRAIRARIGVDDLVEWRALRCPLSPCLTSMFLALDEETADKPVNVPSVVDFSTT